MAAAVVLAGVVEPPVDTALADSMAASVVASDFPSLDCFAEDNPTTGTAAVVVALTWNWPWDSSDLVESCRTVVASCRFDRRAVAFAAGPAFAAVDIAAAVYAIAVVVAVVALELLARTLVLSSCAALLRQSAGAAF